MGVRFSEEILSWYGFAKAVWGWVSIFENKIQIGMDTNLGGGGCLYQNFRKIQVDPPWVRIIDPYPPPVVLGYTD